MINAVRWCTAAAVMVQDPARPSWIIAYLLLGMGFGIVLVKSEVISCRLNGRDPSRPQTSFADPGAQTEGIQL